jgi:hypothetical protein
VAELTQFQVESERCLRDTLDVVGFEIHDREILGDKIKCIHLKVRGADVEIWIFDNQVEYRLGRDQYNFEISYFRTPERTVQEFSTALRKDLESIARE